MGQSVFTTRETRCFCFALCIFSPLLSAQRSEPLVVFVLSAAGRKQPLWGDSRSNNRKEQSRDKKEVKGEDGGGLMGANQDL